jgi:threonine/homoserine/homoserine lactone efflux protein
MTSAVTWGFVLGCVGSMPVAGAVSALVLKRGLSGRFRHGLALAVGAAMVEGFWCFAVIKGASWLTTRWPGALIVARIVGGVLLVGLGIYLLRRHSVAARGSVPPAPSKHSLYSEFRFGAVLVAANPAIPLNWLSLLAVAMSFGLSPTIPAVRFALAASLGIVSWFALLLWLLSHWHRRLSARATDRIMCGMGVVLVGAGLFSILKNWTL